MLSLPSTWCPFLHSTSYFNLVSHIHKMAWFQNRKSMSFPYTVELSRPIHITDSTATTLTVRRVPVTEFLGLFITPTVLLPKTCYPRKHPSWDTPNIFSFGFLTILTRFYTEPLLVTYYIIL